MDLERELRDVLTSDRRVLPASLVPLERVHAGASRRRRKRAAASAALAVAAVAVAVPLGLAVGRPDRGPAPVASGPVSAPAPTHGTPTSAATPSDTPTPDATSGQATGLPWDGKLPLSVTATSTRTFVVLGGVGGPCPSGCLRLTQSNDGGRTFTALPVPAEIGQTGVPTKDGVQSVRFGSGEDGWLFGGDLWSSHDGGHAWSHVTMTGPVLRLEAAAGSAWALVGSGDTNTLHLWRSPVGSDEWTRVPAVTVTGPADLSVQGDRVVVLGAQPSRLWVGGTNGFTEHPSPCPGATSVAMSSVGTIWATCGTGTAAALHVSSDGVAWSDVPVHSGGGALPNDLMVGARTDSDAIVAIAEQPFQRLSRDGTLAAVTSPPPGSSSGSFIAFTTAEVGYAEKGGSLYRTDDGGDTWRRLPLG